jgi:hypothetical protein
MSSTPLRRSARIAAKMAVERARKFTINSEKQPTQKIMTPEIEHLFTMLQVAEQNNINTISISDKVLHIMKIFRFLHNPNLKSMIIKNETFRLSIKNRIYNVTESLKYLYLPYWIAAEYNDVSKNLMEYILDIEKKIA